MTWAKHVRPGNRRGERIAVVHISKTAGTSLRKMLQDDLGPRWVYPGDRYLARLPNGWYPLGSQMLKDFDRLPRHQVLVGHFTAAMADMLPVRYCTATILRDPLQRSLSALAHFGTSLKIAVSTLIDDPEFMAAYIANYQTRILGADGVCDPHQVSAVDDGTLARALRRIEQFDFVGLTERFAESCAVFDQRFQTRIARSVRRENVLRPEGSEHAEFIPRLQAMVSRDQVLYEHAVSRFQADLQRYGVSSPSESDRRFGDQSGTCAPRREIAADSNQPDGPGRPMRTRR